MDIFDNEGFVNEIKTIAFWCIDIVKICILVKLLISKSLREHINIIQVYSTCAQTPKSDSSLFLLWSGIKRVWWLPELDEFHASKAMRNTILKCHAHLYSFCLLNDYHLYKYYWILDHFSLWIYVLHDFVF